MIYLDYAASCVPFPAVIARIASVSAEDFANPGALHSAGLGARKLLTSSRKTIARLLDVPPETVYFTSGGTEANNWAVQLACSVPGKRHIVCAATEHKSILEPVLAMQRRGFSVTLLSPDRSGRIHPGTVEAALRTDTALLCVQAVNNETGVLQDVDALAELAKKKGVLYLCDGVQSFGHAVQNLKKAPLISLSAHKFGGPRGMGCLIVQHPAPPVPMILGGGQEFGLRSGTENVPGAVGFALAAELASAQASTEVHRLEQLGDLLAQLLTDAVPGLEIAGTDAPRSSILCCRFPGISAEEMVLRLDMAGICASPGAACAARSSAPSHVLLAMGYTEKEAAEFVRFSAGRCTTEAEIRAAAAAAADIYRRRRNYK